MQFKIEKENGLKMSILKETTGPKPVTGQTVLMHYELWLNNGTMTSNYDYEKEEYIHDIYDNTYDEKNPFNGPIEIAIGKKTPKDEVYTKGDSIEGLDEALLTMSIGSKVALFIPSDLAYATDGGSSFHTFHGYRTPPDQAIRCNIELVDIIDDQRSDVKSMDDQSENVAYEG